MTASRLWTMALGWTSAVALAHTFVVAVLGKSSALSVFRIFSFAITYALAAGVPATLVMPPLRTAVRDKHPLYRVALGIVVLPAISVPCSLLGTCALVMLGLVPSTELWVRWAEDVRVALLISIAIGVAATANGYLQARLQKTELQLKMQELARERAEKLAGEARFASLTSRLQPHFLFNTMNSISSLIRTDPVRAEWLVCRLAALLRSSLYAREGDFVPLRHEIKLVADYLEIQRVRYGDRLRYQLDVPEGLMAQRVPPFLLQTLVENSVKYAVAPSISGSTIRVVARASGAQLYLEVFDEGPGFDLEQIRPNHGIDNLRERLGSIYAGAARVAIGREHVQARGLELTRAAVELPIGEESQYEPTDARISGR